MQFHQDIRLGTLVAAAQAPTLIPQLLPHGFESFSLTFWQKIDIADWHDNANRVKDALSGAAIISSLGCFGNPLQDESQIANWEQCIDNAHLYGCDMVAGFAGAIEDRPLPESLPQFTKVWSELAKRAEDKGIRIAFENCDMGGHWHAPKFNIAQPRAWETMFDAVPSPNLGLEWEPCHQMVSLVDPSPNCANGSAKSSTFTAKTRPSRGTWCVRMAFAVASRMSGIARPALATPIGRT